MSRDIKFETLLRKLNKELQSAELKGVYRENYPDAIVSVCQKFLDENHYPLTAKMNPADLFEFSIIGIIGEAVLAKPSIRSSFSRDHRWATFKRIVCTGPWFDQKISEVAARRARGISWKADESLYEIAKLGYATAGEMLEAERKAEEIVDKCRFPALRFQNLSQEEQDIILTEHLSPKAPN